VLITNVPKLNFLFQGLCSSEEDEDVEGVFQISSSDHVDDHGMPRNVTNRPISESYQGHLRTVQSHHDRPHRFYQTTDVCGIAPRPTTLRCQAANKSPGSVAK
jgi:hypothetical protein